jgi:hypothetical protein
VGHPNPTEFRLSELRTAFPTIDISTFTRLEFVGEIVPCAPTPECPLGMRPVLLLRLLDESRKGWEVEVKFKSNQEHSIADLQTALLTLQFMVREGRHPNDAKPTTALE